MGYVEVSVAQEAGDAAEQLLESVTAVWTFYRILHANECV